MFSTDFKVRLIVIANKKILTLKQTLEKGGKYTLPGGTVEKMEFVDKALIRECKEELGITLDKDDLHLIHVLHKKKATGNRVTLYFQITGWENKLTCLEPDKFEKIVWIPLDILNQELSPTVQYVLAQMKLGNSYSCLFLDKKYSFKKWKKKEKKRKRKAKKEQERVTDISVLPSSSNLKTMEIIVPTT